MNLAQHERRRRIAALLSDLPTSLAEIRKALGHVVNDPALNTMRSLMADGLAFSCRAKPDVTASSKVTERYYFSTMEARDVWFDAYQKQWSAIRAHAQRLRDVERAKIRKRARQQALMDQAEIRATKREQMVEAARQRERERRAEARAKKAALRTKPVKTDPRPGVAQLGRKGTAVAKVANASRSAWDGLPPFIPDGLEPEEIPNNLRNRFEPEPEKIDYRPFGSFRPGEYAFGAASCAAKAVA